ncbi:hypothetical protein OBBRIDRAFT_778313 [Obba rivulosa]|uniref:Uncharacterized protein n=1 Tax=Obba rivulosa TaxID=1052685 RepID=A0A8E2AWT7_9APHY|nr:hypothetical protein OBBRIDRAFT_778313 [Obba rivulosa]
MATWGIGDDHDSLEVQLLKDQLRTQEARYATLNSQYFKKDEEIFEFKSSLNDALTKLRHEADRVLELEATTKQLTEDLQNERLTRSNIETALNTAQQKIKDMEQSARELQSTLDSAASHANTSYADKDRLQRENAALQARVRELQMEADARQRHEQALLSQSQSSKLNKSRSRRRSSSVSSFRVSALEQEASELRAVNSQQAAELTSVKDRLAQTHNALIRMENEKIAVEKTLRKEIAYVQAALEEKEDECRALCEARGGEDTAEREQRLLERLEEEEERVAALEKELSRNTGGQRRDVEMLKGELQRTQELLSEERKNVQEGETRMIELVAEKEEALDERDRAQAESSNLREQLVIVNRQNQELAARTAGPLHTSLAPHAGTPKVDAETAATVQRLLVAIDRLRAERDGLRRDRDRLLRDFNFVKAETKFAVEDLQAKLTASQSVSALEDCKLQDEIEGLTAQLAQRDEAIRRLLHSARATIALAIVVQHLEGERGAGAVQVTDLSNALRNVRAQLEQVAQEKMVLAVQASETQGRMEAADSQVSFLRGTVERLDQDLALERTLHGETSSALAEAKVQLQNMARAVSDAEAQRDALALQLQHTEQDLETARQELAEADSRYGKQLSQMSSGEATRALRKQIETLEQRVLRRTEQIGVHQHDIKRLETNLRLQEERLTEMTTELEIVLEEKAAMVEDCRTTREERDEAMRKCEDLEEALEESEEGRHREVEALVQVVFSAASKRKQVTHAWRSSFAKYARQSAELGSSLQRSVQDVENARSQSSHLAAEVDRVSRLLEEKATECCSLQEQRDSALSRAQETLLKIDAVNMQLQEVTDSLHLAEEAELRAKGQLAVLQQELQEKLSTVEGDKASVDARLVALQEEFQRKLANVERAKFQTEDQLAALRQELEAEADTADGERTALHTQLASLRQELEEKMESSEQEKLDLETKLSTLQQDLDTKSADVDSLQQEIETLVIEHSEETTRLAAEKASLEKQIQQLQEAKAELEALHEETCDRLAKTIAENQAHLADSSMREDAESHLRAELDKLRARHVEELDALREKAQQAQAELDTANSSHEKAVTALAVTVEDLTRSKQQLEQELAEAKAKLESHDPVQKELEDLRTSYEAQLRNLRDDVSRLTADLDTRQREAAEQLEATLAEYTRVVQENEQLEAQISRIQSTSGEELTTLQERLVTMTKDLDDAKKAISDLEIGHYDTVEELTVAKDQAETQLTAKVVEIDQLKEALDRRTEAHARDKRAHELEVQILNQNRESAELGLRQEVSIAHAQVEEANTSLKTLQEEVQSLQCNTTELEAEVQRLKSLERFLENKAQDLESRVQESGQELSALKQQLERTRNDYIMSEKACKAAEAASAMQSIQHEQDLASLRRQLQALRESPKLEDTIIELQEKNAEMEELLKSKCQEIEENDDRFIEMLKEKKKLTSKIESLTKKVHTLQTKLANNAAASTTSPSAEAPMSSEPSEQTSSASRVFSPPSGSSQAPLPPLHRSLSSRPNSAVASSSRAPVPPIPANQPMTPRSRSRTISAPSARRPKTPEARPSQQTVFRARTPEARREPSPGPSAPMETDYSPSGIGKKRRAPDDFDGCESLPPQGFTTESAPSRENATTPRIRRALQSVRSGFTPVRHAPRFEAEQSSPSRRATTMGAAMISDVTNSPRGTKAAKRGWLGKIRSNPTQPRTAPARPPG